MKSVFKILRASLSAAPLAAAHAHVSQLQQQLAATQHLINLSRSPGLFSKPEDLHTERLLAHPALHPLPNLQLGSHPAEPNPTRIAVAQRLLTAYHKARVAEAHSPLRREGEDMWHHLLQKELPELMALIERNDATQLAAYLLTFGQSFVWFGGITTCIDGYNRNLDPQHIALTYFDKLVCLAESLGALRHENPEQGSWGQNLQQDVNTVVDKIEQALGISISPPLGIIHTDGLQTQRGLFHYRHINALYSATRIAGLLRTPGPICEYGGGLGITALYARRLGFSDYTLFDLPITCLLASHYLIQAAGPEAVTLYGETAKPNTIKVLPYWECVKASDQGFRLSLNQDSFPEIAENLLRDYLQQIKRTTTDWFLSINHECFDPISVHRLTAQREGYRKLYRTRCWVREGYVEELYSLNS
jgi:hypothetical protein